MIRRHLQWNPFLGDNGYSHKGNIEFHTQGDWSADDLAKFASSTSKIYDVLLSYHIAASISSMHPEQMMQYLRRMEEYSGHPYFLEMYRFYRDMLHRRPDSDMDFPLMGSFPFLQMPSLGEVYENIDGYIPEDGRLRVLSIHMASPGSINFSGFEKVLSQLRELIKDIWYRNNHERLKGELEIPKTMLEMEREFGIRLEQKKGSGKLIRIAKEGFSRMRSLESDGKLLLPPGREIDDKKE